MLLPGAGRYFAVMIPRRVLPVGFVEPCIPTLAAKPPSGPGWVHEIKHDGHRLIVRRDGDTVRLFTRRGHDWTDRYPAIASAAAKLRAQGKGRKDRYANPVFLKPVGCSRQAAENTL